MACRSSDNQSGPDRLGLRHACCLDPPARVGAHLPPPWCHGSHSNALSLPWGVQQVYVPPPPRGQEGPKPPEPAPEPEPEPELPELEHGVWSKNCNPGTTPVVGVPHSDWRPVLCAAWSTHRARPLDAVVDQPQLRAVRRLEDGVEDRPVNRTARGLSGRPTVALPTRVAATSWPKTGPPTRAVYRAARRLRISASALTAASNAQDNRRTQTTIRGE